MAHLVACPHCSTHVRSDANVCPHCDATLSRGRIGATATALLMGLSLAGCEKKGEPTTPPDVGEPEYGAPIVDTAGDDGAGDDGAGDDAGMDPGDLGEPEYGVPESESPEE